MSAGYVHDFVVEALGNAGVVLQQYSVPLRFRNKTQFDSLPHLPDDVLYAAIREHLIAHGVRAPDGVQALCATHCACYCVRANDSQQLETLDMCTRVDEAVHALLAAAAAVSALMASDSSVADVA